MAIYSILQDRQGFMWFGTENGLNKYDGYKFVVYKHDGEDSTSLADNHIDQIFEDRAGTLWIAGYPHGLSRFNPDTETFTRFVHDPANPRSLSHSRINVIGEDRSGALYFGTPNGLNKYDRKQESFTRFVHDSKNFQSLSHNNIVALCADADSPNILWIGTDGGGLNRFDAATQQFKRYVHDTDNPSSLSHNRVTSILENRSGGIWIRTADGGISKFDRANEKFTRIIYETQNPNGLGSDVVDALLEDHTGALWIATVGTGLTRFDNKEQIRRFAHDPKNPSSLGSNLIDKIYEDRAGVIWVGTNGSGLNRFDRATQSFTRFVHDPQNPNSLSYNAVQEIYQDRSGVLWFGTSFGGLNKLDHSEPKFTVIAHDPKNANSLSHSVVWSIVEDPFVPNTFWIGTGGGGLNRWNRATGQFSQFVHDPNDSHSLSNNTVRSLCFDHAGALWVGTARGVNKFDLTQRKFTRYQHDPAKHNGLSQNFVFRVYEDRDSVLWIGTWGGGLNRLDRERKRFTHYLNDPKNPYSLNSNIVYEIFEDHAGMLWIGTLGSGFSKFDRNKEQFIRYANDPQNPFSLNHDNVLTFHESFASPDRQPTIWIGTGSGGLNHFDRERERFIHFTEKDGLANNMVFSILEDNKGRLWMSTDNGISCFDPATKRFRNYDVTDGLSSNGGCGNSRAQSRSGEMFFGGVDGITVFHPDNIKDNTYLPPVVITSFKRYNTGDAAGVAIEEKGISAKNAIVISYKDNILNFEFAALSYRNTRKNQYAYKLEGFNENWIQLGTKRDVTFTNLDPGDYTLRVKGSNNDGVWNEEGASLKITITPPWWQTRWAYAFYVLLFASMLFGWRRFELNRVKMRNELRMQKFEAQKLREVDHMKSRFFANISHEFRTPLTLILGPLAQLRAGQFSGNLQDAYDMMLRNGWRVLRLINQLLDLAKLEAGEMSLQARAENIIPFLKGLVLSFASAAERKRINLTVSAVEKNLMVYFDRDKLEKVVSNLLSNALKFTPENGNIAVAVFQSNRRGERLFAPTNEYIEIYVTDTGRGIPADQLNKIFDRFYQVDASQTREHEGTGIGLALTKELVELHHGEILVESEVGRGTTFIVRLPLGKAHLRPEEVVDAKSEDRELMIEDQGFSIEDQVSSIKQPVFQQSSTPSLQEPPSGDETIVLVVEDNRDVRVYIRQFLEPAFKVIEATNGVEGVTCALEIIPDLIISDVMMPKRDGNELCRILKTNEKTSHIPIILLTAKADQKSKVQGLETGADDYLIKPFDSSELLVRVHNLIKLRQQLRERFSREIVLKPQDIAITPMDEVFLNKVKAVVEKYMGEEDFDVETLSREVGMSRAQLHRKLKALTNQPANQFIRSLRLQRAVELLKQHAGTIAEIAYQVGFGSQAYFTTCFHEQFGCSPKEYVKTNF